MKPVEQTTVEQVIAEVVKAGMHPAEVCVILEGLLNQGQDSFDVYRALAVCRAIMCRLDPGTVIPAAPKWV